MKDVSSILIYADDTVVATTYEDNVRKLIIGVNDKSLRVNATETKTMVDNKSNIKKDFEQMSVSINGQEIEQMQSFMYLGICITDDG